MSRGEECVLVVKALDWASFLAWLQPFSVGLWASYLISLCLNFSSTVQAVLAYLTFGECN